MSSPSSTGVVLVGAETTARDLTWQAFANLGVTVSTTTKPKGVEEDTILVPTDATGLAACAHLSLDDAASRRFQLTADPARLRRFAADELGLPIAETPAHLVTILVARSTDPNTGALATWFCEPITQSEGVWVQPAALSIAARDAARSIAARITNALGGVGLYTVTLSIEAEDAFLHHTTCLPTAAGDVTLATQRLDQYELLARAVLNLPCDSTLFTPGAALATGDALDLAQVLAIPESNVLMHNGTNLVFATAETAEDARTRIQHLAE